MLCLPKGLKNYFSSEVNILMKLRSKYTITGGFLLLLDLKYENRTHRNTWSLWRSVKFSDIQYFGNVIYVFQKGTVLLYLIHPRLNVMRPNITLWALPLKEVCFKDKWQDANKYIYTISSSKRVSYGTFEKNKEHHPQNCKDISIVTAPACQGNQWLQYCQPFLEFPERKKRWGKKKKLEVLEFICFRF